MRMREDENIAKYVERVKASVSAIRAFVGDIKDKTVVSKVLRTLLLSMQLEYLLFKKGVRKIIR